MTSSPQPLTDFLALCLAGKAPGWDAVPPGVSPEQFLATCRYHGIAGLLYHTMNAQPAWSAWPEAVRVALHAEYRHGVAADLLRAHHLAAAASALAERNVRHIVIKGQALAQSHYPEPGTRSRCDIDLFIDLADIQAAQEAFVATGYAICSATYKTHQFTVRRQADTRDLVQFDVHWRILNAPRYARALAFAEAFAEAAPMSGCPATRVLGPVHALLLACMHRDGSPWHDRDRLLWIHDIHLLYSGLSSAEQLRFAREAVTRGVQACCLEGLERAAALFGTGAPETAIDILRQPGHRRGMGTRLEQSALGLLLDDWCHLPRWSDRRRLLGELFAPPADSLLLEYGKVSRSWLPWLYLRKIGCGLVQRLSLR